MHVPSSGLTRSFPTESQLAAARMWSCHPTSHLLHITIDHTHLPCTLEYAGRNPKAAFISAAAGLLLRVLFSASLFHGRHLAA